MKVPEHEHPLKLIELQQKYPPEEEEEEEEEEEDDDDDDHRDSDPIIEEGFRRTCGRCTQKITMYHRYYYRCSGSCDYSLHKFCAEMPTRLVHTSHPHPLTFGDHGQSRKFRECSNCYSPLTPLKKYYECSSCDFFLDINCAIEVGKNIIYHPSHPHLLMCAIGKSISCRCNACGRREDGNFYQCTTCATFIIHESCAFLPETMLIQSIKRRDTEAYHTHPLTISYSFPKMEQIAKHHPKCRICGRRLFQYLWNYKCDKCIYYVHLSCATSSYIEFEGEAVLPVFPAGYERTHVDYNDYYYRRVLHLPFPDETHSIPKHLFFKEIRAGALRSDEANLKHIGHQHPLILVEAQRNDSIKQTSLKVSSFLCHNPMKKTQLLCNGCLRPIMTMPFFKCTNEDEHCNFTLHEWCTRLHAEIKKHPGHSQHTLVLMSNILDMFFSVFHCAVCRLPCNGFAYCCVECGYYVDVTCGLFIRKQIRHEAHPNCILQVHEFARWDMIIYLSCHICLMPLKWMNPFSKLVLEKPLVFSCRKCDIHIHPECALLLPKTIRHKYDKHPMHLSYLPIENHKSEYFCEICEEDLNPHAAFYHCQDCVQSVHTACAPLILQSETETYIRYQRSTYFFLNIKFGGILNTHGHPHPLSFAQGIASDGECSMCGEGLQYKMIFKCLKCKFAIDYECCESLNKL